MASARALAWVDRLIWTLVYGGAFAVILGIATGGSHLSAGWSLGVLGGAAVIAGVVLVWVRSRMSEAAPGGAQSSSTSEPREKA